VATPIPLDNPTSRLERVKIGARETTTFLATVDDLIIYATANGGVVVEFVVNGKDGKPRESYRMTACPEDADRLVTFRNR
jgi:hypothetical protein